MIIGGLVLVECVRCKIQHTIVEILVAQDQLIGLCLLLRSLTFSLRNEHLIVQITFVHRPKINETEHQDDTYRIFFLQLAKSHGQQDSCTYQNNIE